MPGFNHPPLAAGQIDAEHRFAALGDLELESGETILDYRQSYVTHGELDRDKSNAVLVCISLTGNHHRLDFLIGPGKALDPARHFIIAADPIGNGLSTSPSNSGPQPGMRFPRFTIRDMVEAQYRLLTRKFGISRLQAVIGASMGGMQALQWAVSHRLFMRACVAMTPMAKSSPWAVMVTETARSCLMADPAWGPDGFTAIPERGWRAYSGLMTALLGRTPAALAEFLPDCAASHLWFERVVAQNRASGFDAHDYLYQSWAYEAHDVGATAGFNGDTGRALASVEAKTLVLAPPLDLFNPAEAARHAASNIPGARFAEIPSMQGHQAATSQKPGDAEFLNRVIGEFLAGVTGDK
ncbi:MAG TPA: alpha/beta fold hydrolase [Burkholderiales bacterium]|jgi:homoserine O-acetyltransferase|nr:alpha/beta fold hydrolase [Burkholderiales bacterium]